MLYPIGIQTFSDIRRDGYVYVDKTAQIYRLASTGKYYFLSRPRRFGKSLLVSTMEAYFSGRKELFRGLAIDALEKEWTERPVLHLDLSGASYNNEDVIRAKLNAFFSKYENQYGIQCSETVESVRFDNLIEAVSSKTGRQVAILIDEYDKPVIDNLTRPELREFFRETLQGFYSVMKSKDACIKFGFLTGVTKIGRMSVFSGLNNLQDISMDERYIDICGITESELKQYFDGSVQELAAACGLSKDECYARLARMYDGYHFRQGGAGIYNPFSVLNTFNRNEFGEYWFETGTPSFLVKYLKEGNYNLDSISRDDVSPEELSGVNYADPQPITLMYQSGYLTIKGYDERFREYTLDYPNEEVKSGFLNSLSQIYTPALSGGEFSVSRFIRDVERGDVESFMNRFSAFLAGNGYDVQGDLELYFQNTMSVMFKMMGLYVKTEYHTSRGRIDIVMDTADYVYVIELKRDSSPEAALQQIEEKGYAQPFLASGKQIIKLGVNFSSQTRCVDSWKMG